MAGCSWNPSKMTSLLALPDRLAKWTGLPLRHLSVRPTQAMPALELSQPPGYKRLHLQTMSESKISCPHCAQHIVVDDAWAGQTINCPSCQQPFTIPGTPPTAVPLPSSAPAPQPAPGLRIGSSTAPPPAPPSAPFRPQATAPAQKVSGLAIASLVLSLLGCFGLTAIAGVICGHLARKRIRENPSLSGGALALIGLIIGYLMIALAVAGGVKYTLAVMQRVKDVRAQRAGRIPNLGGGDSGVSTRSNVKAYSRADKPADPVSGTVYGVPFTYTRSMLQQGVKCLEIDSREGTPNDQVIVVSLNPKPGEGLTNRSWHITAATQGLTPTVLVSRLGLDLHGRPLMRGYQMDLTIGAVSNGVVSGTITLKATGAIPVDIKGNFNATFD